MALVNNYTGQHVNFFYNWGGGNVALVPGAFGANAVNVPGIGQGMLNATVLNVGAVATMYPGLHLNNINIGVTPDGHAFIGFSP